MEEHVLNRNRISPWMRLCRSRARSSIVMGIPTPQSPPGRLQILRDFYAFAIAFGNTLIASLVVNYFVIISVTDLLVASPTLSCPAEPRSTF